MDLGRLESLNPRTVWQREDHDFTPWLLDNAERLGEALGIDLQLEASEHLVGGFSLDLLGRDLTNDAILIVENQLEGTDHGHLGQLLTYTAGTGAATIVWIAADFREEHRQALDWLNEHTDETTRFFGVKLEVVRIGESAPAPLFNIVAQPNDWQKHVRVATGTSRVSGKGVHYVQFWTNYLERLKNEHREWSRASVPGPANWLSMPSPVKGTWITASFAERGRLRHELYIDSGDADKNLARFTALQRQSEAIEHAYGRPLEFEELPHRRACRIAEYAEGDASNLDRHDEYIDWFFDAGERLRKALDQVQMPPDLR